MTITVKPEDVTLVIAHGHCADGMGSMWACKKRLKNVKFWEAFHGDDPPDCTGEVVALLDFAYKRPVMERIVSQAKGVVVIDHHISAQQDLEGMKNIDLRFDMDHSGAVLSWQYFHENKPAPILLKYIEDRDLWNWNIEHAREFLTGLDSLKPSFENYDYAARYPRKMIAMGIPILAFQKQIVNDSVKKACLGTLDGFPAMIVNENHREFVSDVGNQLAEKHGKIAAMWWLDHETGKISVSLRSTDEIGIDVSEIAANFGGGGHKNASGFGWEGSIEDLFKFE